MRYGVFKPIPMWVGGTQKWTGRSGTKPRAIVIHRMEGSLEGSDTYLRREFNDYNGARLRASTHFGVGLWGDTPTILTWVDTEHSAWGWWASPNDVPTPLAKQVLGDLMYPIQSFPYYASRIDLNRAVIAIEVEGFHDQPWDPRTTAKVRELIDAIIRVHGPMHIMAHTDCSPKPCPGMRTFQAALPGYYGKRLGSLPKPTPVEDPDMAIIRNLKVPGDVGRVFSVKAGTTMREGPGTNYPVHYKTPTKARYALLAFAGDWIMASNPNNPGSRPFFVPKDH